MWDSPAGCRIADSAAKPVAWFYADTGAEIDLGFGEHDWEARIRTEKIDGAEIGTSLKVSTCKLDTGGSVTILAEGTKVLTETNAN